MSIGLVLGKFMPPHNGHVHLVSFAQHYVDTLYIIVEKIANESIPSELRCEWMKKMFPACRVLHLQTIQPQDPSETPDFWTIWKNCLDSVLPEKPDYLFASEAYGLPLATIVGAQFIPVDPQRVACPISATKIRENATEHWEYLPAVVRPYFLKKVCIFGPESSGKSTLTKNLANHYRTIWVPEYARSYLELHKRDPTEQDMLIIAKGQSCSERSLSEQANRVIFADTDPLSTRIWSEWLFGQCSSEILPLIDDHEYDLYLLLSPDTPWHQDDIRYFPTERWQFHKDCRQQLEAYGRQYVSISGPWKERWQQAINAIDAMLSANK